jgi:hypothetical protein
MQLLDFLQLLLKTFLNTPLYDQVLGIAGILYIIPFIFSIHYFRRVGSFDYLIFATITGLMCSNLILFSLGFQRNGEIWVLLDPFTQNLLNIVNYYPFAIIFSITLWHCVRLKWGNQRNFFLGIICLTVLFFIRQTLMIFFWDFYLSFNEVSANLLELVRIFVGIIWVYAYITTDQIMPYKPIQLYRKLWIFYGVTFILLGSIFIIYSLFPMMPDSLFLILEIFVTFFFFSGIFIVALICIFKPEMFLLSQTQLVYAKKLYERAQASPCGTAEINDKLLKYMCTYIQEVEAQGILKEPT